MPMTSFLFKESWFGYILERSPYATYIWIFNVDSINLLNYRPPKSFEMFMHHNIVPFVLTEQFCGNFSNLSDLVFNPLILS